jgi:hypothetical protein
MSYGSCWDVYELWFLLRCLWVMVLVEMFMSYGSCWGVYELWFLLRCLWVMVLVEMFMSYGSCCDVYELWFLSWCLCVMVLVEVFMSYVSCWDVYELWFLLRCSVIIIFFFYSCLRKFIWIEPLLGGHPSYKATIYLSQRWPLNTGLSIYVYVLTQISTIFQLYNGSLY